MLLPKRMNRRTWMATWAVLCVAGLAATAALNASLAPDEQPEKSVSAECAQYIADIERQLAKAEQEGRKDGVVALSGLRISGEDDCDDEVRDHFGERR